MSNNKWWDTTTTLWRCCCRWWSRTDWRCNKQCSILVWTAWRRWQRRDTTVYRRAWILWAIYL